MPNTTAAHGVASLPPEVIEQDHQLEADYHEHRAATRTSHMTLAELRWRHTLGPEGLLYNEDGSPALVSTRKWCQTVGDHQRRTFAEYAESVGRKPDTIGRMARGYDEWLRRQAAVDGDTRSEPLTVNDCVALMSVKQEDRPALEAIARERQITVGSAKRHLDIERRSAAERDARLLETHRQLGIPSKTLMSVEERREIGLKRRAEDVKPQVHTPLDDAGYEHKMTADRLWSLIREKAGRDVLERQVNRAQDTLDMVRLLVEEMP